MRDLVNEVIDQHITLNDGDEINYSHPFWTILMGIEHEKIHLETTTVLIRQLELKHIKSAPKSVFVERETKSWRSLEEAGQIKNSLLEIPNTEVKIGRVHTGFKRRGDDALPLYGWDNEFGTHNAKVLKFEVSERLVTNADFLLFVQSRAYHSQEFWSDEGWRWV